MYFRIISDSIFYSFLTFSLIFTLSCYYFKPKIALVIGVVFGLLSILLYIKLRFLKERKKMVKLSEIKEYENCMNAFLFMDKTEKLNFFYKFICSYDITATKKRGAIYIPKTKQLVFIKLEFEEVNKTDIVRAFNIISKNQTAVIISNKFSSDIIAFASKFDDKIILVNGEEIFSQLKKHNYLPKKVVPISQLAKTKQPFYTNFLNKKRAKNFFAFGLLFLFFGYFVPLKTYYVVCGSVFLIISLCCKIFGKENAK